MRARVNLTPGQRTKTPGLARPQRAGGRWMLRSETGDSLGARLAQESMKLPNSEKALITEEKLRDYLLSTTHPVGAAKARFFRGFGYNEGNSELLAQGLLHIARSQEVIQTTKSPYGRKYAIDGHLQTPVGREVTVRTVWIIEVEDDVPRLVTAHPA